MVDWEGAMEKLVTLFGGAYKGRKVLVTGHSGFKGSWLVLWLKMLGADVTAISLPSETTPNHWDLLGLDVDSCFMDIRDGQTFHKKIIDSNPEIIFHLAAQPLVRRSYRNPTETWSTNVMGTVNLLEGCRLLNQLAAIIVVTTDKCYDNKEWVWGYRETDPLGGHDPYSASKAGSELVAASYRKSFFCSDSGPLLATARAGNVIGGGDWSEDRLIPDLIRSLVSGSSLEIRSPNSTRPWQHVLECLSGYLALGEKLLGRDVGFADAWNFGPAREGNRKVFEVLCEIQKQWSGFKWRDVSKENNPHEAQLLYLDSGKAFQKLGWKPVWTFEEGVSATAAWYQEWFNQGKTISTQQIIEFSRIASKRNLDWAGKALV